GRVRVLDFGLARPLRQGDVQEVVRASGPSGNRITLTQANSYVGTPAYMSPEQHLREPRVDARSDQFSFCVALYEGLYGERPFAGKTAGEVRMSVFRAVPPAPEGRHVPARLRRILLRGLRVDADERYPDMPALLAELAVDPTRPWKLFGLAAATLAVATLG
ncbi:MAG: protein kinase, partial [Phycisphaerales bacterium]|nr:protein kinase [Phycisphaerales bacterium]